MPSERVHMDLIGLIGNSERGYKYCLVLIDVLTRYLIAEPITSRSHRPTHPSSATFGEPGVTIEQ